MNRIVLLAGLLLTSMVNYGQCPNSPITLSTQAEVDDFVLTYPNCTELLDNLVIEGASINNFKGLGGITEISGSLRVRDTQILNFMGLESLETVGGEFDVNNNSTLIDLSGLDLLASVRRFFVYSNASLKSLDGIDALTVLEEPENIIISNNNALISINALSTVTSCPGCFLVISANPNLTNLEGLENIPASDFNFLQLKDNPNLVVCNLLNICTFLSDGGSHDIENNASGCSSGTEIVDNCLFSIADLNLENDIVLTPNPVSEKLQIQLTDGINFERATVYSILGEELFFSLETVVDFSEVQTGIYLVQLQTSHGIVVKKVNKR